MSFPTPRSVLPIPCNCYGVPNVAEAHLLHCGQYTKRGDPFRPRRWLIRKLRYVEWHRCWSVYETDRQRGLHIMYQGAHHDHALVWVAMRQADLRRQRKYLERRASELKVPIQRY